MRLCLLSRPDGEEEEDLEELAERKAEARAVMGRLVAREADSAEAIGRVYADLVSAPNADSKLQSRIGAPVKDVARVKKAWGPTFGRVFHVNGNQPWHGVADSLKVCPNGVLLRMK
jgi:hypothetical protein